MDASDDPERSRGAMWQCGWMGPLEREIKEMLWREGALGSPAGLRAITEGPQELDALGVMQNVVLPMLKSQGDAIARLARELDDRAD
jgi:hypothetical protein